MLHIRKATLDDFDEILRVIDYGRGIMRRSGNPTQWSEGHPLPETTREDIEQGNCYCVVNEQEQIVGTFTFIPGEDPTYRLIRHGRWLSDHPYATIHRLASDGRKKGVAACCLDFCLSVCRNIRIDTHRDNTILRSILVNRGFVYCGIITTTDGTDRMAFQWEKLPR